jgi:hypothetical protein
MTSPRRRQPTRSSNASSSFCTSAELPSASWKRRTRVPNQRAPRRNAILYLALLGAIEAGLVSTMEDAVTVLRQATQPLGPMGVQWLEAEERRFRTPGAEANSEGESSN